ncbi:MAG TPA: hypothetical protein VFA67_09185 [Candidatus Sulfotelmatobacter sp.]|nr:hypothetical protein [Candidatus Sulfotelmatobacter sp.]
MGDLSSDLGLGIRSTPAVKGVEEHPAGKEVPGQSRRRARTREAAEEDASPVEGEDPSAAHQIDRLA